MSLKKNILANYASQIYVTLIGIVMLPLYIKYMGAEAYGLVGFFGMLQVLFGILDVGLTPTLARETARFRGGTTDPLSFRRFVVALEGIFLIVAVIGASLLFLASQYISEHWLHASKLPVGEITISVQFMAVIVAMRWMDGLYRGIISGSERFVWLGIYSSFIASLRFVLVLPLLMFVGGEPSIFFGYQLGIAVIELVILAAYSYRLLPPIPVGIKVKWSISPLKPSLKFSLTIALTSLAGVLVGQTDKLVLSKLLPLADYGYYTLAVLLARGVMMINGPVSGAIMPRMSKLEAEGDHAGLIRLYRQATQFIVVLTSAVSITMAFWAEQLLWVWTGDKVLAHQAAPILILYALGNGVFSVAAFPYYLQYAKGDLRIHLIGNAVFVVLLTPMVIWAASKYGGEGAGCAWLILNLFSFVTWLPLVHRKFEPGLNRKWYFQDVLVIVVVAIIVGCCGRHLLLNSNSRWIQLANISIAGVFVLMACTAASSEVRGRVCRWLTLQDQRRLSK